MLRACCRYSGWLRLLQSQSARHYSTSSRNSHAPSVLFFGSDTFSVTSLRKLHEAQTTEPDLFRSLDVVTREPSPQGRGLKRTKRVFPDKPSVDVLSAITDLRRGP